MKKYFAKYLPVEGKIKEGDMYWHSGNSQEGSYQTLNVCHKPYRKIKDREEYFVDGMFATNCQKVKLFLCSRDIQVGDKVKSFNYPEQPEFEVKNIRISKKVVGKQNHSEIYHLADIQYPNEVSTSSVSNFFKVIGEISPEATWVKEGDKFGILEVKIVGENSWGERHSIGLYKKRDNPKVYCEIKCPTCKHFH
jgi:hypothetical protein